MKETFKCQFCDKELKSKSGKIMHEKACKENPINKVIEGSYPEMITDDEMKVKAEEVEVEVKAEEVEVEIKAEGEDTEYAPTIDVIPEETFVDELIKKLDDPKTEEEAVKGLVELGVVEEPKPVNKMDEIIARYRKNGSVAELHKPYILELYRKQINNPNARWGCKYVNIGIIQSVINKYIRENA